MNSHLQEIDTIPTLVWCNRPDGSSEFLNQRWLDYKGLSVEEARDWGWRAAIPEALPRFGCHQHCFHRQPS